MNPIQQILNNRHDSELKGIFSICTANPIVIKACMERMLHIKTPILIESTANQVDQFGGYTGMLPDDFRDFVYKIAEEVGYEKSYIILGGDHLGPLTWVNLPEEDAMKRAEILVEKYVLAGFTKIHLDTSMKLSSDDKGPLDVAIVASRGVRLMKKAEEAYQVRKATHSNSFAPIYVIGSEVPIPGGSQHHEESVQVTNSTDFTTTVETYKIVMKKEGLMGVWDRVIAVVVQPGVEFGDEAIVEYNRDKAIDLVKSLDQYPGIVFEGHSTDYQQPIHLKQLVEDSVAILKVGPALTYGLKQGLFALSYIEEALIHKPEDRSDFRNVLLNAMKSEPKHWIKHYTGSEEEVLYKMNYSRSDRSRYYFTDTNVINAYRKMFENIKEVPLSILSQFMPVQYTKVRRGKLLNQPEYLVKDWIKEVLNDYIVACIEVE
jgi:D-tagatose-1,6-bisphosphate aldolase subunit GatZ/KbaZ